MKQMKLGALCSCLTMVLIFFFARTAISVAAAEEKPVVLRVAFPQVEGFTMTDEYGRRYGLIVDYLTEIAKYTGWEYEYIDTINESIYSEFLEGKYDLMGGTYYSPSLEEVMAYPDYSCGRAKSVLLARWDDYSIRGYDITDLNGKTIGVYNKATENIRRLQEFLTMNGLKCVIKEYKLEEFVDGKLFVFLENGEVDLILGNTGDDTGDFRAAVYFDAQPHYIVTTADNQEVLDGLNWAMEQIMESNPNFSEECYEKNFPGIGEISVFLNDEEQEYIQNKGLVTVAVPPDYHPFFCMNNQNRIHDGMIPDILKRISEFTGLKFTYVYAETYADAIKKVKQGEVDMAGFFLGNELEASQGKVSLTKPYVTLSNMVVRNKSISYPSEGLTCGILYGRELPADIVASEVQYFNSVYEALEAVNQGKVDFFYGLSSQIEIELQDHYLPNAVPVSLWGHSNDIAFALSKPADARLLTILNKSITNLSNSEMASIVNKNMISLGTGSLSLKDLIYANPFLFVTLIAGILLLFALATVMISHSRLMLEKAKADSRAKSEFLSRMSHEIRTPMNAIVGLTDLTSVAEGVPESVQTNLSKLRSSSRYLLSLINDILDMSRIDSGMMSIANEPFSLTQMVDELESMMKTEAERRGLELTIEMNLEHTDLVGDAIRLRQVLTNLLSNAIKFTPAKGTVKLSISEISTNDKKATYSFHVTDTGMGITPENQKRIFNAFEQVGTNISKSQGTGLGLPISRNIVRFMGGELKLTSEYGKGSDFYFVITLPYGSPVKKSTVLYSADLLDEVQLLLVEDNELNAEIASELLEMQGAQITLVTDGKQAVELFSTKEPGTFDAILMDIQMPIMNGLEAAQAIRSLKRTDAATIPIVAMTANSFQEDIDAAMQVGMNGFVTKPLDIDYLYSVLQDLLKRSDEK